MPRPSQPTPVRSFMLASMLLALLLAGWLTASSQAAPKAPRANAAAVPAVPSVCPANPAGLPDEIESDEHPFCVFYDDTDITDAQAQTAVDLTED